MSKLFRFHAADRADIEAMISGDYVLHARMLDRVRHAVEWFRYDARCDQLPRIVDRFNRVERDWFGVPGTRIELPDDIDR